MPAETSNPLICLAQNSESGLKLTIATGIKVPIAAGHEFSALSTFITDVLNIKMKWLDLKK